MKGSLLFLLLMVLCMTGCAGDGAAEETEFHLTKQEREKYEKIVGDTLYDYYWRYDSDTLSFFGGAVPDNNKENDNMFLASEDAGVPMRTHAGKEAVSATVDLLHYNGDKAGRAYFYFVHGSLAGVYYTGGYDNSSHSLNVRNLYLADGKFEKYEGDTVINPENYSERDTVFAADGFLSNGKSRSGQTVTAVIENGNVVLYRYGRNFSRYRTLYFNNGGKVATSASFIDGYGFAVLVGNLIVEGEQEGQTTFTTSEKVAFYNDNFVRTGEEMELISPEYTCVASDSGKLVLNDGKILEYYDLTDGKWMKEKQYFLDHGITDFHIDDLDGDGTPEYLMTDGLDLYLYHKNENGFIRIWSTHLGVASLSGSIYTGDLNQDGVKEVYVCDTTGTAIRYVLTAEGLSSRNEGIAFGDRIYPLDYDQDGKEDYVVCNNVEQLECKLYIAK